MTTSDAKRTAALADLSAWLIQQGLQDIPSEQVIAECCRQLRASGIPVMRAHTTLRAHHPEFGAMAFRWDAAQGAEQERFSRRNDAPEDWVKSPLFFLMQSPEADLRVRMLRDDPPSMFSFLETLRGRGATDYFAQKLLFGPPRATLAADPMSPPEGMVLSWTSDGAEGFSEADLEILRALLPTLGLVLKTMSLKRMAEDLLATYLGRDAGRRVLSGAIQRGSNETLEAVILYFDLQGFTKLSEALPGPEIIELLNDYFGSAVAVIEENGGNVLKFMGDGLLAIFNIEDVADAGHAALETATQLRGIMAEISARRRTSGLTATGFTLALHAGDVLYGNIGGTSRLDFTVIGPAVNTTARISGMTSLVDQSIIISARVAGPALAKRTDLVSIGTYRLRGVAERQELFTLD
jgi:adenylate cyclase